MLPEPALVERFRTDLDALIAPGARIGVAVSGGPDSLALLLLAAAAAPGRIEAATVDHALRPESRAETEPVAAWCEKLAVPHAILTAEWPAKPQSAVQERARDARYGLLGAWARDRGLEAIVTAHHLDDQAETFVMRLARGAGVRGLSAMRALSVVPRSHVPLLRPLLGWRRSELERICADAGLDPVADPSNSDAQFERVRVRHALAQSAWLDPQSVAASAAHLGEAEAALEYAVKQEWSRAVTNGGAQIRYRPDDAPPEIRRRILAAAIARLAVEGDGGDFRGRELDRLLATLGDGGTATIRGVLCAGGREWCFSRAPPRTR
jgi:tRNA(Ile)-lysidine synthase